VALPSLPLSPKAVYAVVKERRQDAGDPRPLAVAGANELASVLRRELGPGAEPGSIRGPEALEGAAALVYVLTGDPAEEDTRTLSEAERLRVPVVAVLAGPTERRVPYVLATAVVRVPPGSGFPVGEIARVLADRLGDRGVSLAARIPVLRRAVCEWLIKRVARVNGIVGAAVFVPGVDMPVLTLNQLRLVLGIAAAHGQEIDRERVPEILGVVLSGLGFRALAHRLVALVPVAGWAVKGGVAYGGTRTIGEAAMRYFEARTAPGEPETATRPQASASPAAS
jgi:uncharacterized protein (DUF697 family)